MTKIDEKVEAIKLRKNEGMAIGKIAKKLGVSKGSVSVWVRNVELTDEQKIILSSYTKGHNYKGSEILKEKYLKIRKEAQNKGRERAKINKKNLYQMGCTLYWAEGSKTVSALSFVNSDVKMVKLFVDFLIECFDVRKECIALNVSCYLNNGLTIEEIENYWLRELGDLPKSCLKKHIIRYGSSGKRKNKWQYGMCIVRVHDVKIVQEIYGAIQEYAGHENEKWLN